MKSSLLHSFLLGWIVFLVLSVFSLEIKTIPQNTPGDLAAPTNTPLQGLPVYRTATAGPTRAGGVKPGENGKTDTLRVGPLLTGCFFGLLVLGGATWIVMIENRKLHEAGRKDADPSKDPAGKN